MAKILSVVLGILFFHSVAFAFTPPSTWVCVHDGGDYPISVYINPSRKDDESISFSLGDTDITGIEYIFFHTQEARADFFNGIPNVGFLAFSADEFSFIRAWIDYVYDPKEQKLYKRYNSFNFFDDSGMVVGNYNLRDLGLNEWGAVIEGLVSWNAFFNERDYIKARIVKEKEIREIKQTTRRWQELEGEYREEMIRWCEMSWSGKKEDLAKLATYNENGMSKTLFLDVSSINPIDQSNNVFSCWIQLVFSPPYKVNDNLYANDIRAYTYVNYINQTITIYLYEASPAAGKGHWQKAFAFDRTKLGEVELRDCVYKNLPKYLRFYTGIRQ